MNDTLEKLTEIIQLFGFKRENSGISDDISQPSLNLIDLKFVEIMTQSKEFRVRHNSSN